MKTPITCIALASALLFLGGCHNSLADFHAGIHTQSHSKPAAPLTDPSTAVLYGQDGTFAEPPTMTVFLPIGGGIAFTLADGTTISLPTSSGTVGQYTVDRAGHRLTVYKADGSTAMWALRPIAN